MSSPKKHAFYPTEPVEEELKGVPRGQISERVNDLILKGLTFERQQEIALAYRTYDAALARAPARNPKTSSSKLLSAGAFQAEDETEDFI
jgi:hypothetical protein